MSFAGTARTLLDLLRSEYTGRFGEVGAPDFRIIGPNQLDDGLTDQITLLAYRIEQDPSARYSTLRPTGPGSGPRTVLRMDMRFLLTAWVGDGEGELQLLERAMSILDDFPVLSGSLLAGGYPWEPDTRLLLTLDHLSMEDSLRLWDALSPSFRLSVPYLVRTVRISPTEQPLHPPVDTATRVYLQTDDGSEG